MKPIVPVTGYGHRHRWTDGDTERDAENHHQPQPRDVDTEALRGLLPEAQRAEGAAPAEQDEAAEHDERQRNCDVLEAPILQRAEQPEGDLQHHERI